MGAVKPKKTKTLQASKVAQVNPPKKKPKGKS